MIYFLRVMPSFPRSYGAHYCPFQVWTRDFSHPANPETLQNGVEGLIVPLNIIVAPGQDWANPNSFFFCSSARFGTSPRTGQYDVGLKKAPGKAWSCPASERRPRTLQNQFFILTKLYFILFQYRTHLSRCYVGNYTWRNWPDPRVTVVSVWEDGVMGT